MGHGKGLTASLRWVFWLQWVGIMSVIFFLKVTSADPIGVPGAGLLCISECTTCPAICAPPPPSSVLSPPPPSSAHTKTPPSNIPSIMSPPSPSTTGSHGYSSYPYYFFYSSKANPTQFPASISCFLLLLFSSHLVHLC